MAKEPLEIFHRLSRVITQAASLAEVYDIILDEIVNTMGVERASIMRYDPKSRMLKIVAARGIEPEVWKSVEIPVGEGQSGRVFQEGKSILIKNLKMLKTANLGFPRIDANRELKKANIFTD